MQQHTKNATTGHDVETLRVLDPFAIERIPWEPVAGCPGVLEKELWRSEDLVCALIRYEPRAGTPGHRHGIAEHHIWVISGWATIGGRHVVAGSYTHVPAMAEHPVRDVGPDGCVLLQVHHRCAD